MADSHLIHFLKNTDLFQGLSEENLQRLIPFIRIQSFHKGDWILREGDRGEDLYFIKSGKAEVVKGETDFPVQIATLHAGEWTGEMSVIEKKKRSASVRALNDTEVLVLLFKELRESSEEEDVYGKIVEYFGRQISYRLRNIDENLVNTLKEKLQLIRLQDDIGKTVVSIFIFMAFYLNVARILHIPGQHWALSFNSLFYPISIVVLASASLWMIHISGYSLPFYGLTLKNGPRIALEAIAFSIPWILFLIFLKWVLITFFTRFQGVPLFQLIPPNQTSAEYLRTFAFYIFLIPTQEITVRGFLQTSFRNFLQGPDRVLSAILVSNVIFGIFHTVADIWLTVLIFTLGIFWGYLFEKQKSLVGCLLSHILIGGVAFFILHYEQLIGIGEFGHP